MRYKELSVGAEQDMAVILLQDQGAVIDHEAWLLRHYGRDKLGHDGKRTLNFQGLFDIRTPFLMDGEAQKIAARLDGNEEEILQPKRKKRKELPIVDSLHNAAEIKHVLSVFTALRSTSEFKTIYDYTPKPEDYRRNNLPVRTLSTRVLALSNLTLPQLNEANEGPDLSTKMIEGTKYILPPRVRYVCDDVCSILDYTSDKKFDLIVMDPPWLNKHVRRKKSAKGGEQGYNMMSVKDVLRIPITHLLKHGGLLAVWSTNKPSQIQEFLEGLHTWGVEHVATWYWLKVTRAGEPVTPLMDGTRTKLPYERIFIARKRKTEVGPETIPNGLVFCSVPSGLHSHKPPVLELVKPFLVSEPQCLELFARSLVPGWTSFGLEVLRLQHGYLFEDSGDG